MKASVLGITLGFVVSVAHAGSIYDKSIRAPNAETIHLKKYKGKPVLFVNIATRCGFTPQLEGLEKLHKKYSAKGLTVIGIPSNDFGSQTPEKDKEVVTFCKLNYGVSFPISLKQVVKGDKKNEIVKSLIAMSQRKGEIAWNFEKFLLSKNGTSVKRFSSRVKPMDKDLVSEIEKELK